MIVPLFSVDTQFSLLPFKSENMPMITRSITMFNTFPLLTDGLLRPRSLGSLSTSCKYHFNGIPVCPPEDERKPMAMSSDERTSQISDKDERRSEIIWLSMARDIEFCKCNSNS